MFCINRQNILLLFILITFHFFNSYILTGIIGDSNTKCFDPTSSHSGVAIGAVCVTQSDCLYGHCVKNVCTAPALVCPTNTVGTCLGSTLQIDCLKTYIDH